MCDEQIRKWIIGQYNNLEEERNALDRYLWQVPVASLGIIALLLRALFSVSTGDLFICLGGLLSAAISVYAALLVGRLHERKASRCERMLILEDMMGTTSIVKSAPDAPKAYPEDRAEKFVNRFFGSTSTAVLGVSAMMFIAVASLICCVYSLFHMI